MPGGIITGLRKMHAACIWKLSVHHRERTVEPVPAQMRAISCPLSTRAALQPWQVSPQCCLELLG